MISILACSIAQTGIRKFRKKIFKFGQQSLNGNDQRFEIPMNKGSCSPPKCDRLSRLTRDGKLQMEYSQFQIHRLGKEKGRMWGRRTVQNASGRKKMLTRVSSFTFSPNRVDVNVPIIEPWERSLDFSLNSISQSVSQYQNMEVPPFTYTPSLQQTQLPHLHLQLKSIYSKVPF